MDESRAVEEIGNRKGFYKRFDLGDCQCLDNIRYGSVSRMMTTRHILT